MVALSKFIVSFFNQFIVHNGWLSWPHLSSLSASFQNCTKVTVTLLVNEHLITEYIYPATRTIYWAIIKWVIVTQTSDYHCLMCTADSLNKHSSSKLHKLANLLLLQIIDKQFSIFQINLLPEVLPTLSSLVLHHCFQKVHGTPFSHLHYLRDFQVVFLTAAQRKVQIL